MAFLQKPVRWLQLMASKPHVVSAAPNFAFELAVKRTTDEDMAGLDLGGAVHVLSGSERVHAATLKRFTDRFARFNLPRHSPAALVWTCRSDGVRRTRKPGDPPVYRSLRSEKLSAGHAKRCESGDGTPLISYGVPRSPILRIVDPETDTECPAGTTGEIWVHGDNVAHGLLGET